MLKISDLLKKIKANKFLILGRAGADIYPEPPGTKTEFAKYYVTHLGGSSANISVALTRLGGACSICTCVSDDALGRYVLNQLNDYGVNTSLIRSIKGNVRVSFAVVESTVEDHQSIIYRNGAADLYMNVDDINKINFNNFSCLIVTGTTLALEPSRSATFEAIRLAKMNGLSIFLDIDYRPYTWKSPEEAANVYLKAGKLCDVLIGNDYEFGVMAGDYDKGFNLSKELSKSNCCIVVYKMGEKGSIAFVENTMIKTGIFNVKVLKPTGAGDAFMGTFIASLLNDKNIKDSIIYGSAAAAIVVTKVGCSVAMPNLIELEQFVNNKEIINFQES